jgi:hypothetical protein
MRVSGRQLRRAVGIGFAALMLAVGVAPVGATAPGAVGNINVVVTGSGASAYGSRNTTVTTANYRDAPVVFPGNRGLNGGGLVDGCFFLETGLATDGARAVGPGITNITPARSSLGVGLDGVSPLTQAICGNPNPTLAPAAYPLWEVQTGTPGRNVLVVPPTLNPPNGTRPQKVYGIETFR